MTLTVRPEEPADRDASIEVERAVFAKTQESDIVVAVRDDAGSFALIAEEGSRVVGHVQMSKAWIGDQEVLALGPIAVTPTRQSKGYGTALVAAALADAAARSIAAVVLLGSPSYTADEASNQRAVTVCGTHSWEQRPGVSKSRRRTSRSRSLMRHGCVP